MRRLIEDVKAIFVAAVRGVQADRLLKPLDFGALARCSLSDYRRVVVAGMGKAAMAMAGVVEEQWEAPLDGGAVVVPEGYPGTLPEHLSPPAHIDVLEGGHPVPDARSAEAGRRLLDVAEGCTEEDLLLALISGGGTALCARPSEGLSLEDLQTAYRVMLEGGVEIHAMNAVRKHLTRVGGGQLARAAHPAEVAALAVSDVAGDDLSVIASGPTVPDPSTFEESVQVLRSHSLWEEMPGTVRRRLEAGRRGEQPETPTPGDSLFEHVHTELIGSNADALKAARQEAEARGYRVEQMEEGVTGEAREVGRQQAEAALQAAPDALDRSGLFWGGETTVTVRGDGTGGRNQEAALAAALALDGAEVPIVYLSGGTDGIDGPTDAAGAWATPATARRARQQGLDPQVHLDDNDAYPFFEALGTLLTPGPTHTNAMDVQIALVGGE